MTLLKWLGVSLMVLLLTGAIYQQIGVALDAKLAPAVGDMVSVNGRAVHLHCEGAGRRTFVLDAGAGAGVFEWWRVQPLLAKQGRTCAFDRAGLGWSAPSGGSADAATAADELAEIVKVGNIPTPFVYAGHSLGADIAIVYAAKYPNDVSALVLIEPGDPKDLLEDFHGTRSDAMRATDCDVLCYAAGAATYLGIARFAANIAVTGGRNMSGTALAVYRAALSRASHVMTTVATLNAQPKIAYEVMDVRSFGNTPVLTFASSQPRPPEGDETVDDGRCRRLF